MTLNLLTYVPEGFVLLVDSMSTSEIFVPLEGPKVTTYDHATKMFELGSGELRAAAMISGAGNIGGTLVSQIIKGASDRISKIGKTKLTHDQCVLEVVNGIRPVYDSLVANLKRLTLEEIKQDPNSLVDRNKARAARGMEPVESMDDLTEESMGVEGLPWPGAEPPEIEVPVPVLEIVVASHTRGYAACLLHWPGAVRTPIVESTTSVGRAWWWGSGGAAVARVIRGYDAAFLNSSPEPDAAAALAFMRSRAAELQMPVLLETMPLQEAVYFSEYLGDVACGYDRFKMGPAGVGGAVNIMIITDAERTWLRQDRIQSRPTAV